MPRAYRVKPTCHPEMRHVARGMCAPCYFKWRSLQAAEQPAPERAESPIFDERRVIPTRSATLRQHAVTEFPVERCRKCAGTIFRYEGREARCFTCGQGVWLVRDLQHA